MTDLARRLAGLRRQAGVADIPGSRPQSPSGASTAGVDDAARLAQLRKLLDLSPATVAARSEVLDRTLVGEEIAPGLHYLDRRFPVEMPEVLDLDEIGFPEIRTRSLLAFDTETTGLAGGTGTRAFMIGAADWSAGELRIRQIYITSLAAEAEMLQRFCGWLEDDTILVSYNGKSYDRPLLTTRLRIARQPDPLLGRAHIDLLHPIRRRYRGLWPNCKLATAERELLDVCREDDLPGAEAPAAWLSYLRGGPATALRRVVGHNLQDLRSLFGLVGRIACNPRDDRSTAG